MRFEAGAASDVGRRRSGNEDCYVTSPGIGSTSSQTAWEATGRTRPRASWPSRLRARTSRLWRMLRASLAEKCRYAVSSANNAIYGAALDNPGLAGMGTTLISVLVEDEQAALAHVGDSRAYLIRGLKIRQLTDDHSIVGDLLRRHEISEDDAREHPHRQVLTRALGVRKVVEPDLAELTLSLGDVFVLCSDGLTYHIEDHEIGKLVAEACQAERPDLQAICDGLVELANDRGGEDNITVILVHCDSD